MAHVHFGRLPSQLQIHMPCCRSGDHCLRATCPSLAALSSHSHLLSYGPSQHGGLRLGSHARNGCAFGCATARQPQMIPTPPNNALQRTRRERRRSKVESRRGNGAHRAPLQCGLTPAYPPKVTCTISLGSPISSSLITPRAMYSRASGTPGVLSGVWSSKGNFFRLMPTSTQFAVPTMRI